MARASYLSNGNDDFLFSVDPDYLTAREGAQILLGSPGHPNVVAAGQSQDRVNGRPAGLHRIREGFLEFPITPVPETELVTSAGVHLHGLAQQTYGDPWTLEFREHDFGPTVAADDWVSGDQILTQAPTVLAEFPEIRTSRPQPPVWRSGSAALRARVAAPGSGTLRVLMNSNKTWLGHIPTGIAEEFVDLGSYEHANGPYRPRVEVQSTTRSALTRVMAAETQLSDGSVVYLEADGAVTNPVVSLRHRTKAGAVTTLGTLAYGNEVGQFAAHAGAQTFSLVRDAVDNLVVLGPAGSEVNGLCAQAWVKGSGHSWSVQPACVGELPDYDGPVNSTAAAYHTGDGRLVAVVGHAQGRGRASQTVTVSLDLRRILAGGGNPVVATALIVPDHHGSNINTSGSGLDIMATGPHHGVVAAVAHDSAFGEGAGHLKLYPYRIHGSGVFTQTDDRYIATRLTSGAVEYVGYPPSDGDVRCKLVPVSETRFAVLAGGWVRVFSRVPGTVRVTASGGADLFAAGLAGLGPGRYAMDAIYDASRNSVWIYYLDSTESRTVRCTAFNVGTKLLTREVRTFTGLQGPSGSTNVAIRAPRGGLDERLVQLYVANRAADGTHSALYLHGDGLDQAPNAPVLVNLGSFTATQAKTFRWTFSDRNPRDGQSAYEAEVRVQSTQAVAYTSGKVASSTSSFTLAAQTLSNTQTYEWRVRVYDQADQVSSWSAWQPFSTVTTSLVAITDPATDDPPGLASPRLTVTWTFSAPAAVAQSKYRVRVTRTDTGATVFNSGFINGPEVRSYTVQGLVTDVQQRVEVVVEDTSGALSGAGTRLVTPSFSKPDPPTVMVQSNEGDTEGSGVLVSVLNPEPTGDLPPAGRNDIYRSPAGRNTFIKVGEAEPDGVFLDLGVASGVPYEYKVAAVAGGATFSEVTEPVSVSFLGVYVHRPSDPEGTLRHFLYGGTGNADQVEATGSELRFAGRTYPVYDFGEQLDEQVSVEITIPWAEDHVAATEHLRDVARSRAVHCYRDSRGRKTFGVVTSVSSQNVAEGFSVSLTVRRTDFNEELPT